jgi:hypothetical protein
MASAIEEWGAEDMAPAALAETLSGCFSRVMRLVDTALGGASFRAPSLVNELERLFPEPVMPPPEIAPATRQALQEWTKTVTRTSRDNVYVVLRRSRLEHAFEILSTPVPQGQWRWVEDKDLPPPHERAKWVVESHNPILARLTVDRMPPDVADIFAFGSGARDDIGQPLRRSWAAQPELVVLSKYTQLDIDGAWIGSGYQNGQADFPLALKPMLQQPTGFVSWSMGIFAENWWLAACRRTSSLGRKRGAKKPDGVAFRAVWLRAADRARMFVLAKALHDRDWIVTSYGAGSLGVSVPADRLPYLLADAFALGLSPNISLTKAHGPFEKLPGQPKWGGAPATATEASFRLAPRQEYLLALDGVPFLEPDEQKRAVIEIVTRFAKKAA